MLDFVLLFNGGWGLYTLPGTLFCPFFLGVQDGRMVGRTDKGDGRRMEPP